MRNVIDPTRSWVFSVAELRTQLVGDGFGWTTPGDHVRLIYTRFSSQSAYLASLYNQVKQLECGVHNTEYVADLKAAFIEDC